MILNAPDRWLTFLCQNICWNTLSYCVACCSSFMNQRSANSICQSVEGSCSHAINQICKLVGSLSSSPRCTIGYFLIIAFVILPGRYNFSLYGLNKTRPTERALAQQRRMPLPQPYRSAQKYQRSYRILAKQTMLQPSRECSFQTVDETWHVLLNPNTAQSRKMRITVRFQN